MSEPVENTAAYDARPEIIDVVDEQFDRIQPVLAPYIADPRRYAGVSLFGDDMESKGAFLAFGQHKEAAYGMQDDTGLLGRLMLYGAQPKGRLDAAAQLLVAIGGIYPEAAEATTTLLELRNTGDLRTVSGSLRMWLTREAHPKNWNARALGDPYEWGGSVGADPSIIGLRHKGSTTLDMQYVDKDNRPTKLEVGIGVKSRFDRADPLFIAKYRLTSEAEPDINVDINEAGTAQKGDAQLVRNIFKLTKDLRPVITPIAVYKRKNNRFQQMINERITVRDVNSVSAE